MTLTYLLGGHALDIPFGYYGCFAWIILSQWTSGSPQNLDVVTL